MRRDIYSDRSHHEYRARWQCRFVLRRKLHGPQVAEHARRYISELRAMRRRLLAGGSPSFGDYPRVRKTYPGDFLDRRSFSRLKRAADRGELSRALARRGFFGGLKEYYTIHSAGQPKRRPR